MREVIIRQASTPSELYVPVSTVNYIIVPDECFYQPVKLPCGGEPNIYEPPKFTKVNFFYVNQIS